MTILINPGTTPQVYSAEGHMIAAGERLDVAKLDETAKLAVDAGRLRTVDVEPEPVEDVPAESRKSAPDAESTRSSARRSGGTSS